MANKKKTILDSFGVLNDVTSSPTSTYTPGENSFLESVHQVAKSHYSPDVLAGRTEFKAIVLKVVSSGKPGENSESGSWWERFFGSTGASVAGNRRVIVRARIPELHVALPVPSSDGDHNIIDLYPEFTCAPEIYDNPGVGHLIRVSFGNVETLSDPVIIGKEAGGNDQETLSIFADQFGCISAVESKLKVDAAAGESLVKRNRTRNLTETSQRSWEVPGEGEDHTSIRELTEDALKDCADLSNILPTAKPQEEPAVLPTCKVSQKLSDAVSPNSDSPSISMNGETSPANVYSIYSTWNGKERGKEEMVKVSGKLVMKKEVLPAFQKMSSDAQKVGIRIRLNSGFRTFEEQLETRRRNVTNKSKSSDRDYLINKVPQRGNFSPLTAQPGRSNHQSGTAIDLQTGMPRGGPHPNKITKTWRWLANNAHRYGFVRTVQSERWHFVYVGRAKASARRFRKVPKGHKSWDGMF